LKTVQKKYFLSSYGKMVLAVMQLISKAIDKRLLLKVIDLTTFEKSELPNTENNSLVDNLLTKDDETTIKQILKDGGL
jgi:hypothetical protein